MKHIVILVFIALFVMAGCAAQDEPVSNREPKSIITKDDYEDLKIEPPPKEEPVEVDYKKGVYIQNFEPLKKESP